MTTLHTLTREYIAAVKAFDKSATYDRRAKMDAALAKLEKELDKEGKDGK